MIELKYLFSLLFLPLILGLGAPLAAEDNANHGPGEIETTEEPEEAEPVPDEAEPVEVEPQEVKPFELHLQYQAALEIEIGLRLYEEGDDYRAITALKRYRLLADEPQADYMSNLIIGDIYRRNDYPDLSLRHFWSASAAGANLSAMDGLRSYHLGLQELCVSVKAYVSCHAMLREMEEAFAEEESSDAVELARYHRRFVEFILRAPSPEDQFDHPRLQRAFAELNTRNQVFEDLPLKSPALAGIFSAVIPGAGQAYTGRWLDAAIALGFTGLFAGATAYSYLGMESVPLTIVSGIFTTGFYTGNIANAVIDARRQNAAVYDDFFDALHEDLWPRLYFRIDGNEIDYDFDFDWPGRLEETDGDAEPPAIPGML